MPGIRGNQKTEDIGRKTGAGYGWLLLVFNLLFAGVFWWQLPPQIPLFYSLPYGQNQLAAKIWYLILPGLAVMVFGGSLLLLRLKLKSDLFPMMVRWMQLLCLFLLALASVHIAMVVL